uniref:Uncharacterized protein n=1 Tax=Nelumbo nucifera TaxID=4432 RepID=A0A822ZB49_NELNU|nr:TPA_asm: hypothetical protein HUJ06_015002 [Nelumbo nucifera]
MGIDRKRKQISLFQIIPPDKKLKIDVRKGRIYLTTDQHSAIYRRRRWESLIARN